MRAKNAALQARTIDEKTLERFPEAAAGHLLMHALKAGNKPERTLELAQLNFAARPYGDAAIGLARAMLASGKPARALAILQQQQAEGWQNAELDWVMRTAYLAQGQTQAAAAAEAQALSQNPASAAMYGPLFFAPP